MSKENLSDFEKRMILAYSDKVQKKNGSFKQSPETQREQWLKRTQTLSRFHRTANLTGKSRRKTWNKCINSLDDT